MVWMTRSNFAQTKSTKKRKVQALGGLLFEKCWISNFLALGCFYTKMLSHCCNWTEDAIAFTVTRDSHIFHSSVVKDLWKIPCQNFPFWCNIAFFDMCHKCPLAVFWSQGFSWWSGRILQPFLKMGLVLTWPIHNKWCTVLTSNSHGGPFSRHQKKLCGHRFFFSLPLHFARKKYVSLRKEPKDRKTPHFFSNIFLQ